MRLFIAALLPEDIKHQMGEYVNAIKPNVEGVKWEKPEKLHITLKFLGETQGSKADEVSEIVGGIAQNYSPFSTSITRLGGFPGLDNPRVIFIGLSPSEELSSFQSEIQDGLEPLGFPKEKRSFVPHVTVGRIKKKFSIKGSLPVPEKVAFNISHIGIIKSELRQEGSVYTPLSVFSL